MKIKNISCTQFAGIRDRNIVFSDGINVIYGKNESGKSTVVNLISRTLFQNAKLDRRKDREFYDAFFPGAKKGSSVRGDFADGKISFETNGGSYTLSKEWGADARCMLSTPEGVIRDQNRIEAVLKDVLLYGEGVYSDLLCSSQRNTDAALRTILDAAQKTDAKQEITNAVSQAFAESDGIPIDAIEQAINEKIDAIAGKHWDFARSAPMRKSGRWATGLGDILKAYYALEDAKAILDNISQLESDADHAAADYADKDAAARLAEDAYDRFNSFAARLAVQSERKKSIVRIERERLKLSEVLSNWPTVAEDLEKAKALQTELGCRELIDKYDAVKRIADEIARLDSAAASRECPTDAEIMQLKKAQRGIGLLENKLCGMNLNAVINLLGDNSVEIISLRTGEAVDVCEGNAAITEAVKIIVPGVIEMQLSPANVDIDDIRNQITEQKKIADNILTKYGVESLDALEELAKTVAAAKAKLDTAKNRLDMALGAATFEEIENSAKEITAEIRSKEDIVSSILSVCRNENIERFIAARETVILGYATEYKSISELKAKAFDLDAELKKARESLCGTEDIPAEYLGIDDPEEHLAALQNSMKLKQSLRETALTEKSAASGKLESYKENISSDAAAEVEKAKRIFEEQKNLLCHWMHIREVFDTQKESINNDPMQDIADSFTKYLGIISNGRVSSEFPERDRLNMQIYSENNLLDYVKLSEGTKETVSLAFRLAVLDHLFPDGGGVIVFDDPFTDMDADRAERSCALLKECAERHQVIFLTCREDYLDALAGNHIFF